MPLLTDTKNDDELLEMEQAKLDQKKQAAQVSAIKKSIVDPLAEVVEDFSDSVDGLAIAFKNLIKKGSEPSAPQDYFDKDLSKKVSDGIESIKLIIAKLKPIDLSPITSIGTAIENQNKTLINLVTNLPKQDTKGYEILVREVLAMVQKSNDLIAKGFVQTDYSKQLDNINSTISIKPVYEFTIERSKYGDNKIEKVTATPIYKK